MYVKLGGGRCTTILFSDKSRYLIFLVNIYERTVDIHCHVGSQKQRYFRKSLPHFVTGTSDLNSVYCFVKARLRRIEWLCKTSLPVILGRAKIRSEGWQAKTAKIAKFHFSTNIAVWLICKPASIGYSTLMNFNGSRGVNRVMSDTYCRSVPPPGVILPFPTSYRYVPFSFIYEYLAVLALLRQSLMCINSHAEGAAGSRHFVCPANLLYSLSQAMPPIADS